MWFSPLLSVAFSFQNLPSYWNGNIASDERVIFFPALASQVNSTHWSVPIHGWIFEPEEESNKRAAFLRLLGKALSVKEADQKIILQRRVRPFLVDNQSMKRPRIEFIGDGGVLTSHRMPFSRKNGHFRSTLVLSTCHLGLSKTSTSKHVDYLISYFQAKISDYDSRSFRASVHLVPPTGVSIISDIDDTIKLTNVLDKKDFFAKHIYKRVQSGSRYGENFQTVETSI